MIDPAIIEAAVVALVAEATEADAGVSDSPARLLRVPVVGYPNRATDYAEQMSSASGAVLVSMLGGDSVPGSEAKAEQAYRVDLVVIDVDLRNPSGSGVYKTLYGLCQLLDNRRFPVSGDILRADVLRWRLLDYREDRWFYVVELLLAPKLARSPR